MGEADDEDDTNPRRISKPGHPSQSTGAIGAAGPGSQAAAEKRFKHIKTSQGVEAKRNRRKEKAKVVTHARDTIRRAYGKEGGTS